MPPTLAPSEFAARRARLLDAIGPTGIAIIPGAREAVRIKDTHYKFRQDSDFWYLTGFTEPDAVAVLAPGAADGPFKLFVRPRDATREIWDGRRAGPEGAKAQFGADSASNIGDFERELGALLQGREKLYYTLGDHPAWDEKITTSVREIREVSRRGAVAPTDVIALEGTLHELRLCKTPAEADLLRHACKVSADAHVRAMLMTRPGVYEWQVAAEIHHEFERNRMEPGYGSIVGGGENGCILHYVENSAELRDGDLLLIDAGGEYCGYTADITRTFPVNGKFSEAQREVYEVVLDAQLAAIDELKIGNASSRPHEVATRVLTEGLVRLGLLEGNVDELIEKGAQRRFYMHGTGHWLGMDVHDVGRYKVGGVPRPFKAGMVMTVEPGLYIAPNSEGIDAKYWGIGIRIEDDVLVTPDGPEILTADVPKSIEAIEALMRG